jgi:cytochrome c nitrite reductase small subunit
MMAKLLALGVGLAPLAVCILIGMVCGLGGYTFWYAEGGSYFSNDPRSCVNCHIMREAYDGWQKASHHAAATCNDCHVPYDLPAKLLVKAENGFWHSKGFTLQDFHEPIRITARNARVLQANCITCHGDLVGDILGHAAAEGEQRCVHCHGAVGHGPPR